LNFPLTTQRSSGPLLGFKIETPFYTQQQKMSSSFFRLASLSKGHEKCQYFIAVVSVTALAEARVKLNNASFLCLGSRQRHFTKTEPGRSVLLSACYLHAN
jgi:hypothetical protein